MTIPALLRAAAILHWVTAIGFGVFCFPAIRNLLIGRDIPIVLGFRAYGRGHFERVGIPTTVPLLAAFLLVCMLKAVAGFLLWRGSMPGAVLALVLLPASGVFLVGLCLAHPADLRPRLDYSDSSQLAGPPVINERMLVRWLIIGVGLADEQSRPCQSTIS